MADIFLSYSRADRPRAAPLVAALEAHGWSVWWDSALTPGEEFDQVTSAELDRCKAVLVMWTPVSVASRWVRGEARVGADRGVLVPIRFEDAQLPIDVRAIQTTDFDDWSEDAQSLCFQRLVQSLRVLTGATAPAAGVAKAAATPKRSSICVLPFANMSGDPEQEYFSDGITEDVIIDLSKVSALWVAARNTAFAYKGKPGDVKEIARRLGVSHVLEGSVRKSGNRVRITAQLIDGATGGHIWAERYDRDLSDIFALQGEISEAIVGALKVKLLPAERQAIEARSTTNPEAYKHYLMARQYSVTGSERHEDLIARLCRKAVEIDPNYARAWALLAVTLSRLQARDRSLPDGGAEAERAIAIDPGLAEAYSARGRVLQTQGRAEESLIAHETALRLDSDSYEVNVFAGRAYLHLRRFEDAISCFERAAALMENDYIAASLVIQCYQALNDDDGAISACRRALARIERLVAVEPDHGSAMGHGAGILAILGENDRAREWLARAVLLDPENRNLQQNAVVVYVLLKDTDAALDQLACALAEPNGQFVRWIATDNDLDPLRDHPRFKALVADAEAKLLKS